MKHVPSLVLEAQDLIFRAARKVFLEACIKTCPQPSWTPHHWTSQGQGSQPISGHECQSGIITTATTAVYVPKQGVSYRRMPFIPAMTWRISKRIRNAKLTPSSSIRDFGFLVRVWTSKTGVSKKWTDHELRGGCATAFKKPEMQMRRCPHMAWFSLCTYMLIRVCAQC